MASCQTSQWGTSSPYVKLTVTESSSSTATQAVLSWTLQYIASNAAVSSYAKEYTVKIAGSVPTNGQGTYNINGVTGTKTIASGTVKVDKGTAAKSVAFSVSFGFNLTWSGIYKSTLTASDTISVSAKTSYTVTYDANGGSGAPSKQTKWYDTSITLSSEKPTRTGYTFSGWNTNASGTGTSYSSGATYSSNASVTLYAVWTAKTYTVKFDANGGSGAPSNQTKTHGVSLTLSSTKPTRTNYTFKGWGTSASSTTVSYAAGASYTKDAAITLYAVWEQSYTKPTITEFSVDRCDSSGTTAEDGQYALVKFKWTTNNTVSSVYIERKATTAAAWTKTTVSASGTSGTVSVVVGSGDISPDQNYNIIAYVSDDSGSTQLVKTLPAMQFPIDMKVNGKGTSVGKPAEYDNLFDVAWDSRFAKDVYVGATKEWNDGLEGTRLSPTGGIVIQRKSGESPYLDFRLYGTKNTYDGRIIYDKTDKYMGFRGGARYEFDNSIYGDKGIRLGNGDSTGLTITNISTYWIDKTSHNMIERNTDGLTLNVGWAGSSTYKSVTNLRAQTVQCKGSTTWSSDQNLKHDIRDFDEKYDIFYANLKPRAYKYDLGSSGRTHIGYVTQEVEDALEKAGLSTQEFAGVVIQPINGRETEEDKNGNVVDVEVSEDNYLLDKGIKEQHNLAYTEFIALNTYMIQKLLKENTELTKKVDDLEERLSKLEASLNK